MWWQQKYASHSEKDFRSVEGEKKGVGGSNHNTSEHICRYILYVTMGEQSSAYASLWKSSRCVRLRVQWSGSIPHTGRTKPKVTWWSITASRYKQQKMWDTRSIRVFLAQCPCVVVVYHCTLAIAFKCALCVRNFTTQQMPLKRWTKKTRALSRRGRANLLT